MENYEDLSQKVETLKENIQTKGYIDNATFKELETRVNLLSDTVKDLDKDVAIKQEKQAQIYIQIDRLDELIKDMKTSTSTKEDKKKDTIEKFLLLIIGGIISFVFNKL